MKNGAPQFKSIIKYFFSAADRNGETYCFRGILTVLLDFTIKHEVLNLL